MLNISQVMLVRTDSNLCRKELTVHWSTPNSLIRSLSPALYKHNVGDESEAVAPIIWLYQTVDVRKEEVFFPDLLITLQRHGSWQGHCRKCVWNSRNWLKPLLWCHMSSMVSQFTGNLIICLKFLSGNSNKHIKALHSGHLWRESNNDC